MTLGSLPIALLGLCGCQLFVADADREVYRLIEQRQMAALGQAADVRLNYGTDRGAPGDPYAFVPHPVTPEIPVEFSQTSPANADGVGDPEVDRQQGAQPSNADSDPPSEVPDEQAVEGADDPADAPITEDQAEDELRFV